MRIEPFKLERYFAKYEFNAPYLLCCSDCESFSINEILGLDGDADDAFRNHWLGYTESQGNPELRSEIAKLYDRVGPDEVLVHSGAEEAIFIFMNVALNKDDHVIVHYPCYQSLYEIANSIGCEVTKWETREKNGWELDIDFLRKNIKKNTKAVIFNCPHNPTGYLMSREKQREIVEIARENNILVFSDEVYRFLEYKEEDRLPACCDIYENAVSLGVMSKTFGLPGLRIGWVATKNKDIFKGMAAFKDYTTICSSSPSEFLAIVALKNKEKLIVRNLDIVSRNLDLLDKFFVKHDLVFNWWRPKAGAIAFPSLKTGEGIEEFCIRLVEKKGVLLLPGSYYGFGNNHFRIGFGRKNLPECIDKLDDYLCEDYTY